MLWTNISPHSDAWFCFSVAAKYRPSRASDQPPSHLAARPRRALPRRRRIVPAWARAGAKPATRSWDPQRANFNHPFAAAAIYYNDAAGIQAMAGAAATRRTWPVLPQPAAGLVSIGLKDESGRFLPGLIVGDRWFVIGEQGRRYSIVVRNKTAMRLEAVLSVDGLDVLDGRPASVRKRGYLVAPHRQLVVDGFRQSTEAVAAFRFGPVRESYAHEKYGNTQHVGVIGLAIFNELGTNPPTDEEARIVLRERANIAHVSRPLRFNVILDI